MNDMQYLHRLNMTKMKCTVNNMIKDKCKKKDKIKEKMQS